MAQIYTKLSAFTFMMMTRPKRLVLLLGIGLLLTLVVQAQERRPGTVRRYQIRWNANLSAAQTNSENVGGTTYFSASKLQVSWSAPDIAIDHYEVSATDFVRNTATRFCTSETSLTLTGLKSGTSYTINLRACREANCQVAYDAGVVTVATPEEFWQLQGTGNTIATATRIISDGNVGSHAFRFGAWAGANLAGRINP